MMTLSKACSRSAKPYLILIHLEFIQSRNPRRCHWLCFALLRRPRLPLLTLNFVSTWTLILPEGECFSPTQIGPEIYIALLKHLQQQRTQQALGRDGQPSPFGI